jgi:hypothetical protein
MTLDIQPTTERLLATFKTFAQALAQHYPDVKLHTFNEPVGSLTDYQGYHVGIECLFADAPLDTDDLVALEVNFRHLTTAPQMSADVTWGQGHIDVVLSDEWVLVADQTLAQLFACMPELCQAFEQAIQRGVPNTETQTL